MKPAFSVIFFTVGSGAGLGMMFWLALSRFAHEGPASQQWWMAAIFAGALLTLGLLSSTAHLANPRNAWRAFSRFRSSWLSREGVFAVALYPVAGAYLWAVYGQQRSLVIALGIILAALVIAILFCTAMIYACLKTIPRWNNWQTRLAFPLFGLMSGALLMLAIVPQARPFAGPLAAVMLVLGALLKFSYLRHFDKSEGKHFSINQALQVLRKQQAGEVRLLDPGHSSGTFLTQEFMFSLAREKAALVRGMMWLTGFVLPLLLVLTVPAMAWLSAVLCVGGLLCERWLFFAEAQHVVRLYHGQRNV